MAIGKRGAFWFIFVTVALDMIAFGIMAPVLPRLVVQMEGGAFEAAARITGIFGFVWALAQFVCAPLLGSLSDRFGRRPVVLLSNLGLGIDYVLMALAPSVAWLLVGRVVSGITSSSFPTASAYIADITPPEERAERYGMLGAAFGLGFILGPVVGGVLGDHDLRLPFWVAAGLSLANAAYGYFILPESLPVSKRGKVEWHAANPLGALTFLRERRGLVALATIAFLYYLAHEVLPTLFALYTGYRYAWSAKMVGISLAIVGISSTVVSVAFIGPAVKRLGERRALMVGLAFGVAAMIAFGLAPTGTIYLASIPLAALTGLMSPALQAIASRHVQEDEQGRLQGALSSLQGIGVMIGPLLFTQAFAVAVARGGRPWSGVPMLLAAALLVVAMLLAMAARENA